MALVQLRRHACVNSRRSTGAAFRARYRPACGCRDCRGGAGRSAGRKHLLCSGTQGSARCGSASRYLRRARGRVQEARTLDYRDFSFLLLLQPRTEYALYYVMTDDLKFSQGYIGALGSIGSAGWVVGALSYRRLFGGLSSKRILQLSIVLGTASTAAYLLLYNE